MAQPLTQRLYDRLPHAWRDADVDGQLLDWMSLIFDQIDDVAKIAEAISYYPLDDGGAPGDSSALVDATKAGSIADAREHLAWLAQLLGVSLDQATSVEEQVDAVRYATNGWRAGTKGALADAARGALTGSKYVLIEDHYAGDFWAINIRTRASETPDSTAVINTILAKGAKPAGFVLLNVPFNTSWDTLEAERPYWDDWDGSTWVEIEETGAPGADPGDIPDPDEPGTGTGEAPFFAPFSEFKMYPETAFTTPQAEDAQLYDYAWYAGSGDPMFQFNLKAPIASQSLHAKLTRAGSEIPLDLTINLDDGGATIRIDPVGEGLDEDSHSIGLLPSTDYVFTLSGGINGLRFADPASGYLGPYMDQDYVFRFRTVDDLAPPTVVTTSPSQGAMGVPINGPFAVYFSEEMNQSTVNNLVLVQDDPDTVFEAIPASYVWNADGNAVTITPTSPLSYSTSYYLHVTTDMEDTDGQHVEVDQIIVFRTADSPIIVIPPSTPPNAQWRTVYTCDLSKPLDYTNDWWKPYNGISTWQAGTFRPELVQVDTAAKELQLIGIRDSSKKAPGAQSDMISGALALGKKSLAVGASFEFSVKVDKGKGFDIAAGTWPDSNKWPLHGEGDMLETPKGDRTKALTNNHWGNDNKQRGYSYPGKYFPNGIDFSQWHTMRCEWLPNRLSFYCDGIKVLEFTNPAEIPQASKWHLFFQMDMWKAGMGWVEGPPDASTPSRVVTRIKNIKQQVYVGS